MTPGYDRSGKGGPVGGETEVGEFPKLSPTEGAGMEAGKSHPSTSISDDVPETPSCFIKALCSHLSLFFPFLVLSFTAIYI